MSEVKPLAALTPTLGELIDAMNQEIRHRSRAPADVQAPPRAAPAVAEMAAHGLVRRADEASGFLKTLGHEGRLTILCHLCSGEKSVTELENLLSSRQSVVSQQLARLRFEGLVQSRREGQTIYYSILDPKVIDAIALLSALYRDPAQGRARG